MNSQFKTINLSYLEEISGGDARFQKELIGIFLGQMPEFMNNMYKFLSVNETENLAKEAHTAKSSVLIFMMNETGTDLKQIQHLAVNNQTGQIPLLLKKVEKALRSASTELNQYLEEVTELSEVKSDSINNW